MEQVYTPLAIDKVIEEEEKPTKTYGLDLENGRIVGIVDGEDAVRQSILKILLTPRFKCLIYDDQYGNELSEVIIAKDASVDFIKSSAEGFVRDALLVDSRIISIDDFSAKVQGDECYIEFTAETIYGQIYISEVL